MHATKSCYLFAGSKYSARQPLAMGCGVSRLVENPSIVQETKIEPAEGDKEIDQEKAMQIALEQALEALLSG